MVYIKVEKNEKKSIGATVTTHVVAVLCFIN